MDVITLVNSFINNLGTIIFIFLLFYGLYIFLKWYSKKENQNLVNHYIDKIKNRKEKNDGEN